MMKCLWSPVWAAGREQAHAVIANFFKLTESTAAGPQSNWEVGPGQKKKV